MAHKYQTTDATRIKRLIADGVATKTLAKEFGVTEKSISNWVKNDVAPYWTRCACEALERRRGRNSKSFVFCEVEARHLDFVLAVVGAGGGKAHIVASE